MIYNAKIYSVSVTLLRRLIVHCRMIIQYRTCVQRPLEAPKMPNSCEWSERAGAGSLQSPSERTPESSRKTAWRNHSDFQGAWKFWACWYPFGYDAFLVALVRACKSWLYLSELPLRFMHLSPDRINVWKANLLIFTFWCSWFVSLLQERDECSEEITRMRGLEEEYEAEMSILAKGTWVYLKVF